MSTSTNLSQADLLPPPPQTVVGGPTATQSAQMDAKQFQSLISIIGGKRKSRRRRSRSRRRDHRRTRSKRRRTSMRRRATKRHHRKRHQGGNTIPVSVPPVPYNDTSYPSVTNITTQLAGTVAQNNANSQLDAVGSSSSTNQ
jgi:hypothetical protein